jgi:hypothetical protein
VSQQQPAWVGTIVGILRYGLSASGDLLYVVSSDPALKHTLDCMATEDQPRTIQGVNLSIIPSC